jgi:hypothetical protein
MIPIDIDFDQRGSPLDFASKARFDPSPSQEGSHSRTVSTGIEKTVSLVFGISHPETVIVRPVLLEDIRCFSEIVSPAAEMILPADAGGIGSDITVRHRMEKRETEPSENNP